MAAATWKRDLVDRLMDGKLDEYVGSRRTTGRSWDRIAGDLRADFNVEVSGESVRRWFEDTPSEQAS